MNTSRLAIDSGHVTVNVNISKWVDPYALEMEMKCCTAQNESRRSRAAATDFETVTLARNALQTTTSC